MANIQKLIDNNPAGKRKTKNNDLYYKVIVALCEDDNYKTIISRETKNGEMLDEEFLLSVEFKRILASFLKQYSNCTESEAMKYASKFKLTTDQAKTISNIIHESEYITMKHMGKKIQYQSKPDFDIVMSIEDVPETIRANPKDRSYSTKISAHDRLKIDQEISAKLKSTIRTPKKK